jgi:integrase
MSRNILSAASIKPKLDAAMALARETNKQVRIGDGDGLMLVVRYNGAASWVLRCSAAGKRRDVTLGRWPTTTLRDARLKADEVRRDIASGVPLTKPVEVEASDTVQQLYVDWLANREGDISAVYKENIAAAFAKDVLPTLGAKEPAAVGRPDIVLILRAIEARGSTVMLRRVRMWMRQMFEFAIDDDARGLVHSPVPTGQLVSYKKDRAGHFAAVVDPEEAKQLIRAITQLGNYVNRAALLLSVHTFQRPTEIREAVWAEFDLDAGLWVIPAGRMKLDREHWVPLSVEMVAILRAHQGVVGRSGWLFPGRKYGSCLSAGTLQSQLISMGFEGRHTPHGFRAMARTITVERLGLNAEHVEKQLAHEYDTSGLRGAYNRAEYWDARVALMQQWSAWVHAAAQET